MFHKILIYLANQTKCQGYMPPICTPSHPKILPMAAVNHSCHAEISFLNF